MAISKVIHAELLYTKPGLDHKVELLEVRRGQKCMYGSYIEDHFSFGTDRRKVARLYDRMSDAFTLMGLPHKKSKFERPGCRITSIFDLNLGRAAQSSPPGKICLQLWYIRRPF